MLHETEAMSEAALRLLFAVDWPEVELVGIERHEMRAPSSDELDSIAVAGFWVELRDSTGRRLYRQLLHDPIGTSVETPAEDGSWTRVTVAQPAGLFSVLVPALPEAQSVVLVGSPPGRRSEPARELAAFDVARHR